MKPLIFILFFIVTSIFISLQFAPDPDWFVYYRGAVGGLFSSALILRMWNKKHYEEGLDSGQHS